MAPATSSDGVFPKPRGREAVCLQGRSHSPPRSLCAQEGLEMLVGTLGACSSDQAGNCSPSGNSFYSLKNKILEIYLGKLASHPGGRDGV